MVSKMRAGTSIVLVLSTVLGAFAQNNYTILDTIDNALSPLNVKLSGVHVPGSIPYNEYEPLQQRLAYAGPRGMVVSWNTFVQIKNPQVFYGDNPWELNKVANATEPSVTYPTSRTWNNHVKITGLKPNTKYWYRVSNANCYGCAQKETYTFTTSREAGDHTPFSMAVVIDLGLMGRDGLSDRIGAGAGATDFGYLGPNDTNTISSLTANLDTFDFLGLWGDQAYADNFVKEAVQGYYGNGSLVISKEEAAVAYESLTEQYFDEMSTITAKKAFMVAPGNHESNCLNGGQTATINNTLYNYTVPDFCMEGQKNFTGYRHRFRMPSNESGGLESMWYSFDHGMAHFVVFSTETDFGNGILGNDEIGAKESEYSGPFGYYNQQIDWLKNDLANVDRKKTPWVIVGAHRPWYNDRVPKAGCTNCQEAFETVLYDGGVDLVMQGHVHFYNRIKPTYNNTIDPNGLDNPRAPWYIVNGAGGHYDSFDAALYPLQNYSQYVNDNTPGWSRLLFHNATHLTHQFVASANSTVMDSATLYKKHK